MYQKGYILNVATYICETVKYSGSIINDLVVLCDEILVEIKSTLIKTIPVGCTLTNFYILLAFLLITLALLIAAVIYCYSMKYQAKIKLLLSCHCTISKLNLINMLWKGK